MTPEAAGSALSGVNARLGVYGVLGNHDWRYDGERVRDAMERAGIRILENEAVQVGDFWLAVVGDRASTPAASA